MLNKIARSFLFKFSNASKKNLYQVLEIDSKASEENIKSAYYKLAKQYHPDIKPQLTQKFKEVNQAYNILKDPLKKFDYDLIFNKVIDKEGVQTISKSHYNTFFHYGFSKKHNKQDQQSSKIYQSNPFANNYEKPLSNDFVRNLFRKDNQQKRSQNIKEKNNQVKLFLKILASFVLICFLAEFFLRMYLFNHEKQQKITYKSGYSSRKEYL